MTSHLPSCLIPPLPKFPRQSNTTMTIEGPVHTYNKQPHCSQQEEDPCFSAKYPEKKKGPAVQPSTQHRKGPLREAMGSLMVFSTLKPFSAHNTYINSPRAWRGPCLALR